MAFTVADVEEFLSVLRSHPEWRDRVRDEILGEDFLALPGLVARLGDRVESLGERLETVAVRLETVADQLERLAERVDRLAGRVESLADQLGRLAERVESLAKRVESIAEELRLLTSQVRELAESQRRTEARLGRLEGTVGRLEGHDYERRFHAPARLAKVMTRVREVPLADLEEVQSAHERGVLFDCDLDQLAVLDHLLIGRLKSTQSELYVAFEISITVDVHDVERAASRADILRRAGLEVRAYVGGRRVTEAALQRAGELGVLIEVDRETPIDEPAA